jgi:GT2 family glycosyltransferase
MSQPPLHLGQAPATPDLSVVIVSWNVRDLLRECLQSVLRSQESGVRSQESGTLLPDPCPLTTEIVVVDNASADGSAAMVAAEFPAVRLIASPTNRGFTGGNNLGIAAARGRYVFFLNPDTVVSRDALVALVDALEKHADVGVVGPQLRYGDGRLQSSCRRFPTLLTALFEGTPLEWHWPANRWARWYRMEDQETGGRGQEAGSRGQESGQEVDWLVGAALMTRRAVLEQIGGFDEGYFMYSEELDWCRRVKAAGWRIVYLPAAQIIHYEGKSSEQVVAARHIRFQTSKIRYFRKFHGPRVAGFLRAFILSAFAVEWSLEAAKWLLGANRALRRGRMAAYRQLLASGLAERETGKQGDKETRGQ